jgi:hypothetical protein
MFAACVSRQWEMDEVTRVVLPKSISAEDIRRPNISGMLLASSTDRCNNRYSDLELNNLLKQHIVNVEKRNIKFDNAILTSTLAEQQSAQQKSQSLLDRMLS